MKKKAKANGLTGIGFEPDGLALASVSHGSAHGPQLTTVRYHPLEQTDDLDSVLGVASRDRDLRAFSANGVLAEGSFQLFLIEKPQVEDGELKSAVRWKIKDMIDFSIDEAIIDVFSVPGQRDRGRADMLYVVAARRATIREHIDSLERHGFGLNIIDIPELAQRNIAARLPEDGSGVALLKLGPSSGLLTLSRESVLYLSRHIDTGLRDLTPPAGQAVSEESLTDVPSDSLELSLDAIAPEQQQAMDAIVLEVQRSLDYYESHFGQPPINSLVIAPLQHNVPGLVDYFASNLGVSVRELDLTAVLDSSEVLSPELQSRCWFAIGAALRSN